MAGDARTRRQLLRRSAAAAVADTDRLVRLMELELLQLYVYEHVLDSAVVGAGARAALTAIPAYEQAHVTALRERLHARGGQPPPSPASLAVANRHLAHRQLSGRLGQLRGQKDALYLLEGIERVTVGAYYVALLTLSDPQLIVLAAQIMAAEAQHEAILGELLNPGASAIGYAVPSGLVQGQQ